ncbi:MAG: undecaprenyl/decaprenyl-phosphate alpha-N-acetylglucosaminyl 1-phosphate transferase [Lysobacter sp.]|nr:undecaprenyl/decaprenyl-phosphate alpha-N-acetylglucosaminyl 1-phosphate transferase [Lysobacter sp.]
MVLEFVAVGRGLAAAALTIFVLWLLQPAAAKLNLLDFPRGRKDHAHPTPVTGGLAMAVGILVMGFSSYDAGPSFLGFALGAALLIVVGLLDDLYDVKWYWRIVAQIIAALLMVYIGGVQVQQLGPVFGLGEMSLGVLSVPFTVFATVGLINAINMSDGADGLAGLLVAAALVMLMAAAIYAGNAVISERLMIMLGAVVAFLSNNMRFPWQPKARLFMGNAGSAFLGFVIAWAAFRLTQNEGHPVSPVLALWFVPIPVMDTLVLMLRRMRGRKSPFIADRNHIHHLMLEAGFGPTQAALTLAFFSLLCGLAAGQALRMDIPHPWLLGAFGLMCAGWYWLTSRRERAIGMFRYIVASRQPVLPPAAGTGVSDEIFLLAPVPVTLFRPPARTGALRPSPRTSATAGRQAMRARSRNADGT